MLTLERNEAVRATTMAAGMPWDWITFPEFLDSIGRTPKGVNVLSYGARTGDVLGDGPRERQGACSDRKRANRDGRAPRRGSRCRRLWVLGPVLRHNSVQRDYDGTPMITDIMAPDDLIAFAQVLRDKRRGFIQVLGHDFELFEKVAAVSGRPVIWNSPEFANDQHWQHLRLLQGHPALA